VVVADSVTAVDAEVDVADVADLAIAAAEVEVAVRLVEAVEALVWVVLPILRAKRLRSKPIMPYLFILGRRSLHTLHAAYFPASINTLLVTPNDPLMI
jgi:hypothetical protein